MTTSLITDCDPIWFPKSKETTVNEFFLPNPLGQVSLWAKFAIGVGTCAISGIDVDLYQQFTENANNPAYHVALPKNETQHIYIELIPPQSKIEKVIEIFSPTISDLAMAFGVSRQTIYNWLNGNSIDETHLQKLEDFSEAANIAASSGIKISGWLLKRKIIEGKNLMEIVRDSGSAKDAVNHLLQILSKESEQRQKIASRLAGRKRTFRSPESDFPSPNDSMG